MTHPSNEAIEEYHKTYFEKGDTNFQMGVNYILWKLQRAMVGSVDSIQFTAKVHKIIREEEDAKRQN